MFALLLKDRGFPVHIYLQHMMKVASLTRSEAAKRLGQFAYQMQLRKSASTPLNNTMTDWVRTLKTPQWAIISCMQLLENAKRVPKTSQEWAFWAQSRIDNKVAVDRSVPENWPSEKASMWLDKAERYSYWYNRRSEIKLCLETCDNPLLAAKLMYTTLAEDEESCTYANLFFSFDNSKLGIEQVASSIRNDVPLNMLQVEHVCMNDPEAKRINELIKSQLTTLERLELVALNNDMVIKANKAKLISMMQTDRAAE